MGKRVRFQQLEAFCAVMQYGTTTRAAQALNTTQPSVSRRLGELQQRSGLLLFEMDKGRLKPTAEGSMLYNAVQKHFVGLSQIDEVISKMQKSGTGVLNVGCTPTLASGLLPEVIHLFKSQYADVVLHIQTAATIQLIPLLEQQLIDVMMTSSLLDKQNLDMEIIELTQAVCVIPMNHPLANQKLIHAEMLTGHDVLSLNSDDDIARKVGEHFRINGMVYRPVLETSSSITLCAMVCGKLGVAVVNPYVAKIFSGKLLIKPFYPAIITPVQVVVAQGGGLPLLAREFITLLKRQLCEKTLL